MKQRLRDWWVELPLGETFSLAFWNLALVAFIAGAAWMAKGIIDRERQPDCAETFRVTDPRVNVLLMLSDLQEQGLFNPETDAIQDYAWIYQSGQLRFMVALDSGTYSAIACYTEEEARFEDLKLIE